MAEVLGEVERLAQRDIEMLLSYVREIYVSSDLVGFASRLISTLSRVIPSDSVSYLELDLHSSKTGALVVAPPASDYASEDRVFKRLMHEHPLINYYRQTGQGQAAKISDFLTRSQWRRRALYNEFFKELRGIEHQMAIAIPASGLTAGIALGRSGSDFSERDRSVLDFLHPHLLQAHQNAAALTQTQREAHQLRQAVEGSERGMIVLSSNHRTQWVSERAVRWLEEYFEPTRGGNRLPESLTRWVIHQKLLLFERGDVLPSLKPLILRQPGKHLSVRLVVDDPRGETHLLIFEEQHTPLSVRSLQALGLTAREAEILIHIANGENNNEIARTLYISSKTVKKHLDNIYRKLGVINRTEALSRTLKLLGLLS